MHTSEYYGDCINYISSVGCTLYLGVAPYCCNCDRRFGGNPSRGGSGKARGEKKLCSLIPTTLLPPLLRSSRNTV